MKKIYIILTYTGTFLSKIIKLYTKDEASHVSLSLDKELNQMYSFGRLKPYNPFIGGFVHEHIHSGTFGRFVNTTARVIELDVEEEQYESIEKIIKKIESTKEQYDFNTLGLFAVAFNRKVRKDKCFYCAEFIKYLIDESNINIELPELVRPESFKKTLDFGKEIYTGLLREYDISKTI